MAAAGVWQVPTLIRIKTMASSDAAVYRTDPNLKYVTPTVRALWETLAVRFATDVRGVSADAGAAYDQFYPLQRSLIRLLRQTGAKIVTGLMIQVGIGRLPWEAVARAAEPGGPAGSAQAPSLPISIVCAS